MPPGRPQFVPTKVKFLREDQTKHFPYANANNLHPGGSQRPANFPFLGAILGQGVQILNQENSWKESVQTPRWNVPRFSQRISKTICLADRLTFFAGKLANSLAVDEVCRKVATGRTNKQSLAVDVISNIQIDFKVHPLPNTIGVVSE
ncbi:hypothetical protein ZHAS_00020260 [Anopheles sinensis]|uniref:Uncharacterized protein n=1 Tax=Anopheles sinensis TaxID=74873 RepID=A0A084WPC9_ANOSI|nr:hypothetical protein ZHAS_00020260 [Anopheles sinensis]